MENPSFNKRSSPCTDVVTSSILTVLVEPSLRTRNSASPDSMAFLLTVMRTG